MRTTASRSCTHENMSPRAELCSISTVVLGGTSHMAGGEHAWSPTPDRIVILSMKPREASVKVPASLRRCRKSARDMSSSWGWR